MAASSSICCSFTPQATPLNHSSSAAAPLSALCAPFSLKPLPKLVISLYSRDIYARTKSRFIPSVAISSDLEEDVEDEEDDEGSLNFSEREERSFSPDAKLFVGNLPFTVDSAELAGLFGRAGTVEMVEVIYDKFSGRSRGFGFVTMSSAEEAEAAAEQFNGYELQGRPMRVNSGPPPPKRENSSFQSGRENSSFRTSRDNPSFRASRDHPSFRASRDDSSYQMGRERSSFRTGRDRERSGSDDSNKLYVGNLAWGVDNLALESLFGEQGRVKEARVVYDRESGRSRGFGFVTYSSPEEMDHAIEVLDGFDLDGRSIRVSPAEARPAREF